MDISQKYIKMCEKFSLFKNKDLEIGDYVKSENMDNIEIISYIEDNEYYSNSIYFDNRGNSRANESLWIPRQDQLQDIYIKKFNVHFSGMLDRFNEWLKEPKEPEEENSHFNSMEQLWLAFIMKEIYNKIWTGDDWKDSTVSFV